MEIDKIVWEHRGPGTLTVKHKQMQEIDLEVDYFSDCLVIPENPLPTHLSIDFLKQFVDRYNKAKEDALKMDEPPF
tara:strand:- start:310 stop:537 length:228 start_codon:yes stop_codon:yes gene_type:complete